MENVRQLVWYVYKEILQCFHLIKIYSTKKFKRKNYDFQIIKTCHNLERGLSMDEPREGFARERILKMYTMIQYCMEVDGANDNIKYAFSVLEQYFRWHYNYAPNKIQKVSDIYEKYVELNGKMQVEQRVPAGTYCCSYKDVNFEEMYNNLSQIIKTRHSVRCYSGEEVSKEEILSAIQLAQNAPSACNRQPAKVYVVDKGDRELVRKWLEGSMTNFFNQWDKVLIITSDHCAFSMNEPWQYIVSPSIFVGNLSLCLHASGIANCIIQRNLTWNNIEKTIHELCTIPENEQIICCMALGKYPNDVKLPISKRYETSGIVKFVEVKE